MNISDSKAVMDKLNSLISAAEEFGNQSEQLAKVHEAFDKYLTAVTSTDRQMVAVIEKCNEYINSAHELVENDLSTQIRTIVDGVQKSVLECKKQCELVTAEYKETVDLFEQQKPSFEEQQRKMVAAVEAGFENETDATKKAISDVEEKVAATSQNIMDSLLQLRNELSALIEEETKEEIERLNAINDGAASLQSELATVKVDLTNIKEWEKKNELFIQIGAIAAGIAALLSIIGLFI